MFQRLAVLVCVLFVFAFVSVASTASGASGPMQGGWKIPPTAKEEKNPLPVNEGTLAAGKKLFLQKCQRCHGPEAKGDGPDADSHHVDHLNLTNPKNAAANPDGVVFYKVW